LFSTVALADTLRLQDSAPDRYTVVKGDTLWGIAGRFLQDPWKWPQIWKMNRQEIRNPHRIYPGDVIVLDRSGPSLRLLSAVRPTVKLSPQVRTEPTDHSIPSISPSDIGPFLSQPLVIEENGLEQAPRIVSAEESRVMLGAGNIAYVEGIKDGAATHWQIYRPGQALVDPDTKEVLGYQAIYLGNAALVRPGTPATIRITKSTEEINVGDRLVPAPPVSFPSYVPHAPENPVSGRIVAALGGMAEFGQNAIVAINKGNRDHIEVGHVLALYRAGETVKSSASPEGKVTLPSERYGLVFVFRTFDKVSYALVVHTSRPVKLQDMVQTP
jgi:hypothetical protein